MEKVLSIAEITEIEQAYRLGVPSLGIAVRELMSRWRFGLRDDETALRLIFFRWYEVREGNNTGLGTADLASVEEVANGMGGWSQMSSESAFVVGLLARWAAWCFGDEAAWEQKGRELLDFAVRQEPSSRMIQHSGYFAEDVETLSAARVLIHPEIHARYHGRGQMGEYLIHMLSHRLGVIDRSGEGGE